MLVNTWQGFSIAFLCGAPGSGKSYITVRDVLRRLIETDARIVTNLPLNVEAICEEVARVRQCSPADVEGRIHLISREELQKWRNPELVDLGDKKTRAVYGPWDWPDDFCKGAVFILDECHIYCPKKGLGATQFHKPWQDYLGEARHRGWLGLVFVTQDESKVGEPITSHAEIRYELTNSERLRDPFFQIPLGHWYELSAAWAGEYRSKIALVEYRRIVGKLRIAHSEHIPIDPRFFQFYRSHEAAGGGTGEGSVERPLREFEKRPALFARKDDNGRKIQPVWRWFVGKHWWRLGRTIGGAVALLWFLWGGGLAAAPGYLQEWLIGGKAKAVAKKEPGPVKQGAPDLAAIGSPLSTTEQGIVPSDNLDPSLFSTLPAALQKLPLEDRETVERVMRAASAEIRSREQALRNLEKEVAAEATKEPEEPEEPLPVVGAFVGFDAVVVQGRKLKEGDSILLNGGKRRVKIRKIDRAERVVYLEDSRMLRFGVVNADGVQIPGGVPLRGVPSPAPAPVSAGVQSVGQPAEGQPGQGQPGVERSILKRGPNAADGVRPAAGG